MTTATPETPRTISRKWRPMPTDRDQLRAIPMADRLAFDYDQAQLWIARWTSAGDWVHNYHSNIEGDRAIAGRVVSMATNASGSPYFVVRTDVDTAPLRCFSYLELGRHARAAIIVEGDAVEVLVDGEWSPAVVSKVLDSRQFPRFKVEGSRRTWWPDAELRIPGGWPVAVAS